MVSRSFALIALAGAVLEATASAVVTRNDVFGALRLKARQDPVIDPGTIPAQCQDTCAPMLQAFNGCQDDQCLCTNANMQAIGQCLSCVISLNDAEQTSPLLTQAQAALDHIEDDCNSEALPVSSYTISGAAGGQTSAAGPTDTSFSIPLATSTGSPSVFFSSPGSGSGATVSAPAPPLSKSTVTALSTPGAAPSGGALPSSISGGSDSGALNPSAAPISNGAASVSMSLLAVVGAAVILAINL